MKVLAFDLFAIHRRFLKNVCDKRSCDLVDRQVDTVCVRGVYVSVRVYFQMLTQLEGCTDFRRK